jgi:20S proteasome alpha/beta subunit
MTAIVGLRCNNGIVIGTDSSATFSAPCGGTQSISTIEQKIEKTVIIGEHIIVAGTGSVGLGQRFCDIVQSAWNRNQFSEKPYSQSQKEPYIEIGKILSGTMINDLASTAAPKGNFGALVGFPCQNKFHLCEFLADDFQPEFKTNNLWYVSMGSSQPITDPFLALMREIFWEDKPPNLNEGIFAAYWALEHAINVNPGGVNGPIRMAVLERDKKEKIVARLLDDSELEEHKEYVQEAKQYLRDFPEKHKQDAISIPSPPTKK